MTGYEATIYSAIIAAAAGLLGGIIGALGTYFVQRGITKGETKEHARRVLIAAEIKASKQFCVLIDFLEANAGRMNEDFGFGDQLWGIVHECSRDMAYLPNELRADTKILLGQIYQGHAVGGAQPDPVNLDINVLDGLRDRLLESIEARK